MTIRVAVPKEVAPGEFRVAVVPAVVEKLAALGAEVLLEHGAGDGSHFRDEDYGGVSLVGDAAELYSRADVVLKVQPPDEGEIALLRPGSLVVGLMMPARYPERAAQLAARGVTSFAMELLPRISRAQSMDALTSQASVAGYKSALMAACATGRFFPMLTTPAGTIRPLRMLVLGAGVAGLQAIATGRRLGAVVEAYDVRRATKEQVESLGGRFLDMPFDAESEGGYARELSEQERDQQREILADHVASSDAVICTAAVPGRRAPVIVTRAMVEGMRPGSIIVDMAAEGGGNCEVTKPGEQVRHRGVSVAGPLNVPAMLPVHASEMYSRNLVNFLALLVKDGEVVFDWDDQILAESVLTHDGEVKHEPTRAALQAA